LHIGLDPKDKSVLNLVNIVYGRGELVVEVICEYPPLREAAKAACTGLRPQITIPEIGDHIRVTGSYVRDHELGWNEIHPVTRIEILR